MRRQVRAVAVALLLFVTAGECYAQRPASAMYIPFAFQVENKTLPAGEYRIEPVPTGSGYLHMIRQINGDALTIVSTTVVDSKNGKSEPQLIFNRYGKSYVLFQIWIGDGRGRQLSKPEREQELARTSASVEVALLGGSRSIKP